MPEFDQRQIRKLDGGLLLVFRELLVRRQASAVARQLGLSPSAISHALARLRDVFGDPLFVRRSHGLEPTRRALELGPRIEALIKAIDETVSQEAFNPAETRRRFRIVCPEYVATLLGPALVDSFRSEAPHAAFSVRWAILERALRAVRRGEADVALGIFRQAPQGLLATPLFEDDYCVIARRGHPLVKGAVDGPTYASVGHVFVGTPDGALGDEAPIDRQAIDQTYGPIRHDLVRTHAFVTQWETAMFIVAGTDVLADCPRRLASRYAERLGLQVLDGPFRPFRFTMQAVRRGDNPDPGLDWLMTRLAAAVEAQVLSKTPP